MMRPLANTLLRNLFGRKEAAQSKQVCGGLMLATELFEGQREGLSDREGMFGISEFYWEESCGKCTPCREGTYWLTSILERLEHGQGKERDIDLLLDICSNISGKSFCALGDFATSAIVSSIELFREEYEYHIREKRCMV
ncbi:MAG TPA: NADH-ubiquinone oxidoreductase-F iron-sulfur binding region domain-containing protein [Ktedonobacteraceae bacterium]|nr:NADH-ubiquinone oxidoreductase-F iron-sulfur binding region domain-containing protein [Ktedonobacteraceae bacterium]